MVFRRVSAGPFEGLVTSSKITDSLNLINIAPR